MYNKNTNQKKKEKWVLEWEILPQIKRDIF